MTENPGLVPEDPCVFAMRSVHDFLHGELPESTADEIRLHLMACENCMDHFDAEQFISAMLRRCYGPTVAPAGLQVRVSQLSIQIRTEPPQA